MSGTPAAAAQDEKVTELHREFVGMLFALAIAQVAVEGAEVVNSQLGIWQKAPSLSHLLLAVVVIATSWVGWGRSDFSLSPVKHTFSRDFVELLLDVWLVCIYFFLVQGAERIESAGGGERIQYGSAAVEVLWVAVMFGTYTAWDLWTKWGQRALIQRGWATGICTVLAAVAFINHWRLRGLAPVLLTDAALITLVLLFRAMKLQDLSLHTTKTWTLIGVLFILVVGFALAALWVK